MQPPIQWIQGAIFQAVKRLKTEGNIWRPSSANLKNVWSLNPFILYTFLIYWSGNRTKVEVNLSLCLTKHNAMKKYGRVEVLLHAFLTSALYGYEESTSRPSRFTPGKRAPCDFWIWAWVGPRAGLDAVARRQNTDLNALESRLLQVRNVILDCSNQFREFESCSWH